MKPIARYILFGAAVFALGGCAVGPKYRQPVVNSPDHFRFSSSTATNSLADLGWAQVFRDPTLQELITIALTNNYDLKQAAARVEQARNVAVAARAPLFPQIGYGGDIGRGRNATFNIPAANGGTVQSSALVTL